MTNAYRQTRVKCVCVCVMCVCVCVCVIRQLIEKSWEHKTKNFFSFIDLKKAYDSVPRTAMWLALEKLGVPQQTITLIRSFHDGMEAHIRVDNTLLEEIKVGNGLRQGCCLAPVLFNLYVSLVFERWTATIEETDGVGVELNFKMDGKLFRRYTKNADATWLNECQFADDAALIARSREGAIRALNESIAMNRAFGLTVSVPKTKFMVTGRQASTDDRASIDINNNTFEHVQDFSYLGSIVSSSGRVDVDVDKRIAQSAKAFGALRKAVFKDKNLTLTTKRTVYQACVLSVLLYGAECWVPLRKHLQKLESFHNRCIRAILGITHDMQWKQHISSEEVRRRWRDSRTISTMVSQRRLAWLGHLGRLPCYRV